MRRRDFVIALGGTVTAWPFVSNAQSTSRPVVGFLRSSPAAPFKNLVESFRRGLQDEGFIEGESVTVEYRWADNQPDRLPALAEDLVRLGAAVIIGNLSAVKAALTVTKRTPIVFVIADDPVKIGLVSSLNRPGGNITGVTFFAGGLLVAKRLEMLHELAPGAASIAVLMDVSHPWQGDEMPSLEAAARALGLQVTVVNVVNEGDLRPAFATIVKARADALLIGGGPMFTSRRRQLIALASQYALPAIYDQRAYVTSGGLIIYGTSFPGAYRQAGFYAGRILKGANPADLPVLQPRNFELVVNLGTAKRLGIAIPQSILLGAVEVIE